MFISLIFCASAALLFSSSVVTFAEPQFTASTGAAYILCVLACTPVKRFFSIRLFPPR